MEITVFYLLFTIQLKRRYMKKHLFPSAAFAIYFFTFFSLNGSASADKNGSIPNDKIVFNGKITYSAKAEGKKEGVNLFKLAASKINVYWGDGNYRQDEVDGINEGSVIYNIKTGVGYYLNHKKKQAVKVVVNDLSKTDEKVKKLLPHIFNYKIETTGITENILGYKTTVYNLVKSGFVRKGAKAKIWVADNLNFPKTQYDFQTKRKRVIAPVPLSFGIDEGAVLKAEITENGVTVRYEVISIDEGNLPQNKFEIPKGYKVLKRK